MKIAFLSFLSSILLFSTSILSAAEPVRISVTDFGAEPNSGKDCVAAVAKALEACKDAPSAVLVFPTGRYDFFAPEGRRNYGLNIVGQKNLTVDGQGSEFIFHGIMGIAEVSQSENITMRNFSVDWEKPYIAQGNIVEAGKDTIDIRFDTEEYPYEVANGNLLFTGFPGEVSKRHVDGYVLLFDQHTKEIVAGTGDNAIGGCDIFNRNMVEDLGGGIVRVHGTSFHPEPGNYLVLWLGRYIQVGFYLHHSKDLTLENIDMYHALSHGVYAFRTENLTLRKVDYKTNDEKDRVFSIVADGYHLSTCKGLVKIENCTQVGMGDDFLNLHGMNVMIQKRVDDTTVEVGVTGKGSESYVLEAGDEVWFVDGTTVQRGETAVIKEIKNIRDGSRVVAKHIVFEQKLPETVKERNALENKTWNAELEIRGCNILKRHRARGLLVTTPLRAVMEDNYFRTAGTAILVEGDVNYWYESGAVGDLLIRNNVFEDCFTSSGWGFAVITIHPSFQPNSEESEPYHRNIRIEGNTFKTFDHPILFARSVGDLTFTGNTIQRTRTYSPMAGDRPSFWLDGCRGVVIGDNQWGEDVLGKNIRTFRMKETDLQLGDKDVSLIE